MRELARTVAALAAALSSATLLLSACHDKNTRVPFVLPVTPTSIVSGNTVVFYTVAARRGTPVIVSFGYSTDGGLTFNPATPAAGTPPASLIPANPAGAPSFFYWDSFKDLGPGFHRNVILAPTGGGVQALTLPFVADETDSFALPRGAQGMARANVLALPLPDDSVYIVGGTQAGAPVGFGEVYDPVSDDVFTAPTGGLSLVRSGFAGALLSSGRVLTAGGADSNGNPLGTAEYFSKVSGLTRPVPSGLVVPRLDPALAPAPGGGAIVAGGLAQGGVPTPSIELYDPGAGQDGGFAVVLTSTLAAVRLPTATALADGRVLFAGGADANGNAVSTAFLVDSVARTVVPTVTNLSFARVGHRATRLSNGKVLLSGGESVLGNAGSALATCEVFDPATLAFTLTGTMNHARAFHGQDLAGGRVLAVGGQGSDPLTASTGESFSQELALWFPTQFPTVSSRTDGQVVVT
ncbi:hypothetical protein HY251_07770 [bacterium]|nr:hypothetical protein [bacterium]